MRCGLQMSIRFLGAFLLSVLPCAALALDAQMSISQYVRRSWQTEDGLPQNSINGMAQSDDGYLWFGTRDGLCRFDGARFTVFSSTTVPAFRNNTVTSVRKGRNGVIWIGTENGLLRMSNGKFVRYGVEDGLS